MQVANCEDTGKMTKRVNYVYIYLLNCLKCVKILNNGGVHTEKEEFDMYKKTVVKGMILLGISQLLWGNVLTCEAGGERKSSQISDFTGKIGSDLTMVKNPGQIYTVKSDGGGDFVSVQEAVEQTSGNMTLVIYPGIYDAHLNITDRVINMIGTDKEKCILQADTRLYFYVPLNIAAGRFTNLTVYGYNAISREYSENAPAEEKLDIGYAGYAIHIDNPFESGQEIIFENCDIISENSACVGIGSVPDSSIIFRNCEFTNTVGNACIYYHNCGLPDNDGESHFALYDCSVYAKNTDRAVYFESVCKDNVVYVTAQNFKLYNLSSQEDSDAQLYVVNKEKSDEKEDLCGLESFVLRGDSYGNSIQALNSK